MAFGLVGGGFVTKTIRDVLSTVEAKLANTFGISSLASAPVLGELVGVLVAEAADIWEELASIANGLDPDQAEGTMLELLVALHDVRPRKQARRAVGVLTITGDAGTLINQGYRRATPGGLVVRTTEAATIPASGSVDVPVEAIEAGEVGAGASTITESVDAVLGIASTTNASALTRGADEESDRQLRRRLKLSLRAGDAGSDGAFAARLLALDDVDDVLIVSNRLGTTIASGQEGHSVRCIVSPSTDVVELNEGRARAIYSAPLPSGIQAWGTTRSATVTDEYGQAHQVAWDEEVSVDVYITIVLEVEPGAPANVASLAQAAVIDYVASLGMGRPVRALALCSLAAQVDARVSGARVTLGLAPFPVGGEDLELASNEAAVASATSVVVTQEVI